MAAACNLTFCVVGRDARQLAAARALQSSGYTVLGAEGAGQADYILLPMPMDAEAADLARILRAARPGTLALGGRISEPVRKAAQACRGGVGWLLFAAGAGRRTQYPLRKGAWPADAAAPAHDVGKVSS